MHKLSQMNAFSKYINLLVHNECCTSLSTILVENM